MRYQNEVSQGAEESQALYNQKENKEHKVVKTVDLHVLYVSVRDEAKVKLAAGKILKYGVNLPEHLEIMCTVLCDSNRMEIICTESCMSVQSVTLSCP
jgi:hypothetical protein